VRPRSRRQPKPWKASRRRRLSPRRKAAGKQVFIDKGCGGCHAFKPAATTGQTGPPLDDLESLAEKAGQPVEDFTRESIVSPDSYVEEGFPEGVMPPWSGTEKELADLVAFLTKPA
jgi:mono/diheme cytochrome c family protein